MRREEHVGRLQIPVHEAAPVQRRQRRQHAERDRQGVGHAQRAPPEAVGQRLALEELHGDEQRAGVLADFVNLADVRMVDARGRPGFAPEALPRRLVVCRRRHGLHRHDTLEPLVACGIDDAHAAFPELAGDGVVADAGGRGSRWRAGCLGWRRIGWFPSATRRRRAAIRASWCRLTCPPRKVDHTARRVQHRASRASAADPASRRSRARGCEWRGSGGRRRARSRGRAPSARSCRGTCAPASGGALRSTNAGSCRNAAGMCRTFIHRSACQRMNSISSGRQVRAARHRRRAVVLVDARVDDQLPLDELARHRRAGIRRRMLDVRPVDVLAREREVGGDRRRACRRDCRRSARRRRACRGGAARRPPGSVALPTRRPCSRRLFLARAFRNARSSSRMFSIPRNT